MGCCVLAQSIPSISRGSHSLPWCAEYLPGICSDLGSAVTNSKAHRLPGRDRNEGGELARASLNSQHQLFTGEGSTPLSAREQMPSVVRGPIYNFQNIPGKVVLKYLVVSFKRLLWGTRGKYSSVWTVNPFCEFCLK